MNVEKLQNMKDMDIRTIEAKTLIDIRDVHINRDLPKHERMLDFINQIKNPYCYKYGDIVIKIGYALTDRTLDDCMENYLRTL